MTLSDLCNIGKEPAKPLKLIDIHTNEETGVTLFVHQTKSDRGAIAQHALHLKFLELSQNEENLTEDKKLKPELFEEISREMYASLIESWDGVDEEFTPEKAIELLKKSTQFAIQVKNFSEQSGKSLKKLVKSS